MQFLTNSIPFLIKFDCYFEFLKKFQGLFFAPESIFVIQKKNFSRKDVFK